MTLALAPNAGPGIPLCTAATSLASPPAQWGFVGTWVTPGTRCVPEMELCVWSDGTDSVTAAKFYAGVLQNFAIAGTTFTTTFAASTLTSTAHGLNTGDGPVQLTTTGALPAGLLAATNYWVVRVDANTLQLCTSLANAMASTPVTASFTDNGTGTQTYTGVSSQRVHWLQTRDVNGDLLGPAGDGAITLTSVLGYRARFFHSPTVVAYALTATLSASTISASVYPIQSR